VKLPFPVTLFQKLVMVNRVMLLSSWTWCYLVWEISILETICTTYWYFIDATLF